MTASAVEIARCVEIGASSVVVGSGSSDVDVDPSDDVVASEVEASEEEEGIVEEERVPEEGIVRSPVLTIPLPVERVCSATIEDEAFESTIPDDSAMEEEAVRVERTREVELDPIEVGVARAVVGNVTPACAVCVDATDVSPSVPMTLCDSTA